MYLPIKIKYNAENILSVLFKFLHPLKQYQLLPFTEETVCNEAL